MRNYSASLAVTMGTVLVAVAGWGSLSQGTAMTAAAGQAAVLPAVRVAPALASVWPKTVTFHREQLAQHGIIGGSLLVVKDGQIAGQVVEGFQDLETKTPVDDQTIFHWGSITKTFTGIAIMQLRDRGLLKLDDPIVKYVPELRQVHNPFGDMSAITIRHLLSHSGGFRMSTWAGWGGDKEWHPFEPPSWKQIDAMLPYTEILFPPGSKFSYSNPGLIYLGRVIETLTNEDYAMYVTKNIFSPLGMSHAFFNRAPYHLRPHRSHSYFRTDEGVKEQRFDFDTGITTANGGLNAPLTDMAKYVAFLIGDPKKQASYDIVLKRSSLEEMFTPLHKADDVRSMGLTYFVHKEGGLDLISHSGSQNGFLSYFVVHQASRSGYLVAVNTYATSESKGDKQSTRAFTTAIREHFVASVFPALAAARPASSSSSRSSR